MFSIGFSLSKQGALMLAEKCFLEAVVLHPAASMGEQIVAYSVSNMVQRYTVSCLKNQPKKKKKEESKKHEIIDIDEQNTDFVFIIKIPHKKNPSYTAHQIYQLVSDFIERDLCQTTCSFLGGSATVYAFSITFSTPTLIGYPIYLLCEWGAGKLGSYIAKQGGQIILADKLLHSVLKSTEDYLFEEALPELEEIELNMPGYTPAYWKEQTTTNFALPPIINDHFKCDESNSSKNLAKLTSS